MPENENSVRTWKHMCLEPEKGELGGPWKRSLWRSQSRREKVGGEKTGKVGGAREYNTARVCPEGAGKAAADFKQGLDLNF